LEDDFRLSTDFRLSENWDHGIQKLFKVLNVNILLNLQLANKEHLLYAHI
jgi:hypothetical protein